MPEGPPLRIVHCFRSPVGGIFRHVRDLAEQHSRAGHQVGIVCDSLTGSEHEERLFEQIRPFLSLGLTRIPIHRSVGLSDLAAVRKSYNQIKSLQPDILHGHGAKGGALVRIVGSALRVRRYRVARFYTPHGGSLHYEQATFAGRGIFALERLLERFGDALIFVCDFEHQTYEQKVGKPQCDWRTIHNGISDTDFEAIPTRSDSVDYIYVGMLRDLKGPDVFIDAFARTERLIGRPLSALVIGDGPDRDKYETTLIQKGLGRRVGLLPAMPIKDAFATSDMVVVPSRAESMPYIVLETLAAGKTLIASRVGGIPEVLGPDSEALAERGDAADLARVMAKALTTPGWGKFVMPDPVAFKAKFSASVMAEKMLGFYRERLAAI
ncbi:MAG: glycosyltransferase family 4 protein [Rhizobiaceae bacterium]|nr:glycosyltransferase family 4 protein [Rhizobiaceae bacterium]